LNWQIPIVAETLRRLIGVRRLVTYDRRGAGASDPVAVKEIATWEEHAEDLTAVLDAVGSQRTAVMAIQETGPIAILFAAMHPERVSHLILTSTSARFLEADDYPIGVSADAVDALVALIAAGWGSEDFLRMMLPSYADDAQVIAPYARSLRASATPRTAAAQFDYLYRHIDVREVLPLVQAPTLILHPADCPILPVEHGRYLAERIANARLIEWPGADLIPPDMDKAASDVIEFLTGDRPVDVDRVLTTVLFTDIVGSTDRAAALGDHRWHALLDAHDRAVREQVRRFKGREIKTTGDGFVVAFDGPARAIRCAQAIGDAARPLGVELRMGLHTGECEVRGDDLGGLAVHIAARVAALATAQEILVSSTVHDLVIGSGIEFRYRGDHDLKGVPGRWKLFAVGA
jgi:class 3 adenylate cyclase